MTLGKSGSESQDDFHVACLSRVRWGQIAATSKGQLGSVKGLDELDQTDSQLFMTKWSQFIDPTSTSSSGERESAIAADTAVIGERVHPFPGGVPLLQLCFSWPEIVQSIEGDVRSCSC